MNSEHTCVEGIFNFGLYAVKASGASLAIQLRLAKGVLTRKVLDSPSWGAAPGIVGRPLCHDNNEYNLLLVSSQQDLVRELRVGDVKSPVNCPGDFSSQKDIYPGAYEFEYQSSMPKATLRGWEVTTFPTSVNYWLDHLNHSKIRAVHMTMLWGIDKELSMMEVTDSEHRALFSNVSLPWAWQESSRLYLSYAWWNTKAVSFVQLIIEIGKACAIAVELQRHLILPQLPCRLTTIAGVTSREWCPLFMQVPVEILDSKVPGMLQPMPSTFLVYDVGGPIVNDAVVLEFPETPTSWSSPASSLHGFARRNPGSSNEIDSNFIKRTLNTNCTANKPCMPSSLEAIGSDPASGSKPRLIQLSSLEFVQVNVGTYFAQVVEKGAESLGVRGSSFLHDGFKWSQDDA